MHARDIDKLISFSRSIFTGTLKIQLVFYFVSYRVVECLVMIVVHAVHNAILKLWCCRLEVSACIALLSVLINSYTKAKSVRLQDYRPLTRIIQRIVENALAEYQRHIFGDGVFLRTLCMQLGGGNRKP